MVYRLDILSLAALAFLIFSGCASSQSLRMLNDRSEYDNPAFLQNLAVKEGGLDGFKNSPVPVKTRGKIAAIYIFPSEMPSKDSYFWGAWISSEVEPPQWVLTKPNRLPFAPVTAPVQTKISKPKVGGGK